MALIEPDDPLIQQQSSDIRLILRTIRWLNQKLDERNPELASQKLQRARLVAEAERERQAWAAAKAAFKTV